MAFVTIDHTVNFAIDALAKAADMQQLDQNIDALHGAIVGSTFTLEDKHNHNFVNSDYASWVGVPIYDLFSRFSPVQQISYVGPPNGSPDTGWITVALFDGWIRAGGESFTLTADITGDAANDAKFRFVLIGDSSTDTSNEVAVNTLDGVFTLSIAADNRNNEGTLELQVRHETPASTQQSKFNITSSQQYLAHFN